MKEKREVTKFSPGVTAEYKGVTYKAVRQENLWCAGCAFYKRGEPCKSPRGWLCVEEGSMKNLIFKKVK